MPTCKTCNRDWVPEPPPPPPPPEPERIRLPEFTPYVAFVWIVLILLCAAFWAGVIALLVRVF